MSKAEPVIKSKSAVLASKAAGSSSPVCRLVNRHKANVALPMIYSTKADKEADPSGVKGRVILLGTEQDENVVGAPAPEIALNAFERDQLKEHPAVRGMLKKRWLEFQGPALNF